MQDHPAVILALFAAVCYLAWLWWQDYRSWRSGKPNPKAFPGATGVRTSLILLGVIGALLLVGLETAGEYALGVSAQQSQISALFLLAMLGAGFIEELIFRGYLYYDRKGPAMLWASVIFFSLVFALIHTQYYTEVPEGAAWHAFEFRITPQSSWTLCILFLNSVWFYALRFGFGNQHQSLLPCIAAHIASNIGVFAVKLTQGHVTGWW